MRCCVLEQKNCVPRSILLKFINFFFVFFRNEEKKDVLSITELISQCPEIIAYLIYFHPIRKDEYNKKNFFLKRKNSNFTENTRDVTEMYLFSKLNHRFDFIYILMNRSRV